MAFENYPEAEQTTPQQTTVVTQKKNNIPTILTALLVVALLGTWGYIIYDKNQTKETIDQKETMIATTSTQRDQLQKELEDAAMRYDVLKTSNSKKDSAISVKDREIDNKKTRIQQLLNKTNATQAELAEAKRLISSLNGDIDGYKEQVAILQEQKTQLIGEKAMVISQRDRVQRNYDSSTLVIKEKEDLINVGSTLHASNFNIVGINERKSGKEKTTTTAKRVDKLRISFDLDENMLSESGSKEIYVCITAPDGSPIAVQALGSGTFNTRQGQEKPYTQKLDVNYTKNKRQSVSFDWKQGSNFNTGNYKIEVYNNGFKVGEGYKPLKKGGLFS
jgi:cell division protein FtsL